MLRTLIADVTLISEPGAKRLRVGIRWHSGASEQLDVERPPRAQEARRTPAAAVELARRRGPELGNHQLATELNAAGHRTGTGRRFDPASVQWLRWRYQIPSPPPLAPGELSVHQVAQRLGVSAGVVYYWIAHGQLDAQRGPGNRHRIPFPPDVEHACRERVANSAHINTATRTVAAGGAV
jgi:excisionase family DNA binding protein